MNSFIVWMIPLLPLIAFLLLISFGRRWKESVSVFTGSLAAFLSLVLSVWVLADQWGGGSERLAVFPWLTLGETTISMGMEITRLNALMLLVVSLVSFLVQVYSAGYMRGDSRFGVFYAYLSLFTFSMLGLVIAPNLLQLYIFWELVGVCSFLLIGFWYWKPEAKAAAKKAFIVTRVGDIGLFIGIALIFWQVGSFDFREIFAALEAGKVAPEMVTLIALLIFVGAVGKSGQFPLHTWLPDAMEGPTPVSALIHAATMVAAGVYLVARSFPLFAASETAMDVVAYVGAFTALFAATIALVQNDIKRVLAYSTVSQLGYMMLALGAAGYVAGVFHLFTHAFFKALLFLAAGAVIVALNHEQDIRRMGGLWKRHPVVGWLFLIGCLAIAGIPPLSGFFSKDEILLAAYADGRTGVFWLGVLTAFFTAFYMFRLFFKVFFGTYRGEGSIGSVPGVMVWPMAVLAALSVLSGFVQFPSHALGDWLSEGASLAAVGGASPVWVPLLATVVSLAGIALAWMIYYKGSLAAETFSRPLPWLYRILYRKYYVDEAYQFTIVKSLKGLGVFLRGFDRWVVDGLVGLTAWITQLLGRLGSRLQNGQLQTYAVISLIGLVLLLIGLTAGRWIGS
jgi:NADH-quinone oxidoreductase subunit L